jgi:hypothetical protein
MALWLRHDVGASFQTPRESPASKATQRAIQKD